MTESLWVIEQALADLMEAREECLDEINDAQQLSAAEPEALEGKRAQLRQIDEALLAYAKAEVRKVDGIRGMWKHLQMMEINAKAEAEAQYQRSKSYERKLEALKGVILMTMEEMQWREGKPRKLEGQSGALYLKANGGNAPVVITDEGLIPDELCLKTLTLTPILLQVVLNAVADHPDHAYGSLVIKRLANEAKESSRVPSLTLIREALGQVCKRCDGGGKIEMGGNPAADCISCGGSGLQGVPGAILGQRGSHVECK